VYGLLTDRYRPQRGDGSAALDALLAEIASDNPDFTPDTPRQITVNGFSARSIDCDNPSANHGHGEHDWVVAFQRRDGSLRYFVFVAPTPDFEALRPAFQRILQSLKITG